MSKLLLQESPKDSEEYMRRYKVETIMLTIMVTAFFLLGVICLFLEQYLVSLLPFAFAIWIGVILLKTVLRKKQYLYVYEDKICYKNTYQRNVKEICVAPSQYKIELKHAMPRSGYTVIFIFRELDGEKMFTYKAVSITPSMFQTEKRQWETDLFAVGCTVIDDQEVIKNHLDFTQGQM